MEKTTLESAKAYHENRFSVIPLSPKSKRPSISSWEENKRVSADNEQINIWFSNGHAADNIGVITGKVSRIIALDIDGQEARTYFQKAIQNMEDEEIKDAVRNTMQIKTGSGNINIVIGFRPWDRL